MIIQIQPFINDEELIQLKRVVDSTFITENELTLEFEEKFKKYTSIKHCLAYTNGTMALFAAIKSLGIGEGDEIIVPDMTFIATGNAVIMAGAKPVFCDMQGENFNMNLDHAQKLITKKTKAILPVHLYGLAENMHAIKIFAEENNLYIIEDAAQGVGVLYENRHVGTFGNVGVLSFYGNKTITCGEGGLILTNDDELSKFCYRFKNHGRDKKGVFVHDYVGYNFSFTEMQAAIGIAQFNKLERIKSKKEEIYNKYLDAFSKISDIKFSPIASNISPVFWFTNIFVDSAEELSKFLFTHGIQSRRFFYPMHKQPCYRDLNICDDFKITEKLYNEGLSLPSSYNLSDNEINEVIENVKKYFGE